MRRRTLGIFLVLVWLLGSVPIDAQQSFVEITSPEMGQRIRGMVPIIGSASVDNFQYYKVEYGIGANPSDWALIDRMMEQPVTNDQLVVWNTLALPDGVYSLRLRAVRQDGNYSEFYLRSVTIDNTGPRETPTPTQTPTPNVVATQPAVLVTHQAPTGAPTVESTPTGTGAVSASPTPTISGPAEERDLPLDTDGWSRSFIYGIVAMGAALVILAAVFLVRRLL